MGRRCASAIQLATLLSICFCICGIHAEEALYVQTIAGNGDNAFQDGQGQDALFFQPSGSVVVDNHIYVADSGNKVIRRINQTNHVITVAGSGIDGSRSGPALQASFHDPTHLAYDSDRRVMLISDGPALRTLDLSRNEVRTVFAATSSELELNDVAVRGNLMAVTVPRKHMVLLILVGCPGYVCECTSSFGAEGVCMSQATGRSSSMESFVPFAIPRTGLIHPTGVAIFNDLVFVASAGDHSIKIIRIPSGFDQDPTLLFQHTVATLSGGAARGWLDGAANMARFNNPVDLCLLPGRDMLVVADQGNHRVRQIDLSPEHFGQVTTLTGSTSAGFSDGPAAEAKFRNPSDVACSTLASQPVVIISDAGNHAIRLLADKDVHLLQGSLSSTPSLTPIEQDYGAGSGSSAFLVLSIVFCICVLVGFAAIKIRRRVSTRFIPREYLLKTF
eukprot:TRINITY_DN10602_c0_g1_i1.p2 TRINITY_DN10602_c0_g1~~TRINITY_DN10602_c0_g1_i1.p2  ORF type:complete len:447 (+),score=75.97 TRINITY_DN10602_c0_g1_i1:1651-2991(+)